MNNPSHDDSGSKNKATMQLKRSLTLGEAISVAFLIITAVIGFYVNTQVRLRAIEVRQDTYENMMNKADIKSDGNFDKVNDKLDKITEQIGNMRADIATKKDK